MLNNLRKASGSLISKIIIALIVLSFAFFGVGDLFRANIRDAVITVGDTDISRAYFNYEVENTKKLYKNIYAEYLPAEQIENLPFREMTAETIISNSLFLQEAEAIGILVDDNAVLKAITSNPNFKSDGKFSKLKFDEFLFKNGIDEEYYINSVKEYEQRNILKSVFDNFDGKYEKTENLYYHYYTDQKIVDLYKINSDVFVAETYEPSENDLISFHEENQDKFIKLESRDIEYIDLSCRNLAHKVEISEADVKQKYNEKIDQYQIAEKRNIDQLVFSNEDDAIAALEKLNQASPFNEVASEFNISEDIINLGTITKEQALEEFREPLFTPLEGEYTEIIKGPINYHIFKISKIHPASKTPLEKVKSEIETEIINEKSCIIAYETFNQIEDELNTGATLSEVATEFGFELNSKQNFVIDSDQIFGSLGENYPEKKEVILAELFSFNDEQQNISKIIADEIYVIYNINKITPQRTKTLDEVKGVVVGLWKVQKQKQEIEKFANEIYNKLSNKENISDQMTKITTLKNITINRDEENNLDQKLLEKILNAKKDSYIKPVYSESEDKFIIAYIKDIIETDRSTFHKSQKELINQEITASIINSLNDSYYSNLYNKYDVTVNIEQ